MAIVTRVNGDAKGVVNVDSGKIVSFISKYPTAFKITAGASLDAEVGVGGLVEAAIHALQLASTVIMYQVDGAQLSVLVEATGFDDAAAQAAVVAAGLTGATVTSSQGFKLA